MRFDRLLISPLTFGAAGAVASALVWLAMSWALGWSLHPLAAAAVVMPVGGTCVAMARARARHLALQLEHDRLSARLHIDSLTGLMNRAAFHALLERPLSEHEVVAVLFFDLDRFKDVNDTLGHRAGDALLREVAERAAKAIAPALAFARLGGDEFAALIAGDGEVPAQEAAQRVVEALCHPYEVEGQQVSIGASVGIAIGDPTRLNGHELLRRADLAMYAAKAESGSCVRTFDDALDRQESRESRVRVELGKALIEDTFILHYQPLADARTGAFSSAEALLRSQSPALRDVSPAALIGTAEASGQITALTDWTIDTALQAAKRLGDAPVAVNISPIYFRQRDFFSRLMDRLLAANVRPELLSIEITENVLIENLEAARRSLERVREIGINVFLDDFGTGYSSLSYLQHFELDGLKLDKSFLRTVGDRKKANQILRSMIDFGHSLDLRVVIEGVETDWQVRLCQLLGCDLLQGYQIAMPMPLDDLLAFRATGGSNVPTPSLPGTLRSAHSA